jgi:hypothetical protein
MKKIVHTVVAAMAMSLSAFAQTTLPTAWSFSNTTLPTGWSEVNVNSSVVPYYTGSGNTPPAYKLDATGDMLTVFFNSNPGTVSYYLTGNSFSGGTFLVQESVNGTAWTTVHSFTNPPAATYTPFTDPLLITSRYVRFNYSNKQGGNIGIDDVVITAGAAGPAQEINVKQGTNTIVNGGSYITNSPVSTMTPITFVIENLGTANTLSITSVNITGPNASDFVVTTPPTSVAATGSSNLVINFTPALAGTRTATLTIGNDDSDENPYIISLTGIGGSFATQPSAQPSNLVFSNVKSYRITGNFTAAAGSPEGYIVLRKEGAAITDVPTDGKAYKRGDTVGTAVVVYASAATSFIPKATWGGKTYHFAVFAYNGPGVYRNYLTTGALTGSVTTPSLTMFTAGYYTGINANNTTFVTDLHNKINPHVAQFYSNYGPLMVTNFIARDTTNDRRVITCVYSGENKIYNDPFDWTTNNFSREHTYCNSWMPNFPNNDPLPEYNDYHHLFPTNQNDANAIRSNYPLGEVSAANYTYLACKSGTLAGSTNNKGFEPRNSHKGDAARAMMYEATCYTGVSGNLWNIPTDIKIGSNFIGYGQDQNTLKKWHFQDPPDSYEKTRNDYIDSLQHNRNPFIDSVRYACFIDFKNMTYIASPTYTTAAGIGSYCYVAASVGIDESAPVNFEYVLAPNPTTGDFRLMIESNVNDQFEMYITDITGRVVHTEKLQITNGFNDLSFTGLKLNGGVYFVNLNFKDQKSTRKLIIQ